MVYTLACPEKISRQADSGSIIKFISDHNKALKGENEKEKTPLEICVDEPIYNTSSEVS